LCGRNPYALMVLHFITLSPKYLKHRTRSQNKDRKLEDYHILKKYPSAIYAFWMDCTLSLLPNYPRTVNPIFWQTFSSLPYLSFLTSYSYTICDHKKNAQTQPLSRKKQDKKDRDHFYHPPCTKISLPSLSWLCIFKIQPWKQPAFRWSLLVTANSGTANCKLSRSNNRFICQLFPV